MMNRRGVLFGLLAAPMIVRTPGLLMPVKRMPRVGYPWLTNREMRIVMDVTAIRDRNVLLDSGLYLLIEYRGTAPLYVWGDGPVDYSPIDLNCDAEQEDF